MPAVSVNMVGMKELQKKLLRLSNPGTDALIASIAKEAAYKASKPLATRMRSDFRSVTGLWHFGTFIARRRQKKGVAVFVRPYGMKAKKYGYPTNIGWLWTHGHEGIKGNYIRGSKHKDWAIKSFHKVSGAVYQILNTEVEKGLKKEFSFIMSRQ